MDLFWSKIYPVIHFQALMIEHEPILKLLR